VVSCVRAVQNILMSPTVAELLLRLKDIVPPELSRFFFNSTAALLRCPLFVLTSYLVLLLSRLWL
jgi:hypothetical protein